MIVNFASLHNRLANEVNILRDLIDIMTCTKTNVIFHLSDMTVLYERIPFATASIVLTLTGRLQLYIRLFTAVKLRAPM